MNQIYFITGIGTNVGKTIASAIISEHLKAAYWKPIQAGDLSNSDSIKVKELTSHHVTILPEQYKLNTPASPHLAAEIDHISIELCDFEIPTIDKNIIIEGAGGVMVPINNNGDLILDLMAKVNVPVIVISRHYLGSINHTLLTIEAIKNRKIPIKGILYIGDEDIATEYIIHHKTKLNSLGRIPLTSVINKEFIQEQAKKLSI